MLIPSLRTQGKNSQYQKLCISVSGGSGNGTWYISKQSMGISFIFDSSLLTHQKVVVYLKIGRKKRIFFFMKFTSPNIYPLFFFGLFPPTSMHLFQLVVKQTLGDMDSSFYEGFAPFILQNLYIRITDLSFFPIKFHFPQKLQQMSAS